MKKILISSITLLGIWQFTQTLKAENLNHLSQLLSSNDCVACDLNAAGLVNANLAGAQLENANLSNANLSGANLAGANLTGANLTGASLNGANLTGANLTGANLTGTDLRSSYLQNATLTAHQLQTAYIQGATGIATSVGTPDLFFSWGVLEMNQANYQGALDYYNKAIALKPEFAQAYLGRSFSQCRLGNLQKATADAKIAASLFEAEKNTAGVEASQNLIKSLEVASKPTDVKPPEPSFLDVFRNLALFALQFIRF